MRFYNFAVSLFTVCFIVCLIFAPAVSAQEIKDLPGKALKTTLSLTKVIDPNIITLPGKLPYKTLYESIKGLPAQGLKDAENTYFDKDNLTLLLMAGGGSIALHDRADEKIANNFEHHRVLSHDVDKITDWAGNPGMHFAGASIWYLLAAHDNNEKSKQRSWAMIRALSVTATTTIILKGINNNHTPNGKALAWPSGHTSSSFAVAAVLDEFYGPKVGIPAYIGAGFVGFRMMDSGDHWASDVLFGAVLGYVVGHHIAGEHKELELGGFEMAPLTSINPDSTAVGLALTKAF